MTDKEQEKKANLQDEYAKQTIIDADGDEYEDGDDEYYAEEGNDEEYDDDEYYDENEDEDSDGDGQRSTGIDIYQMAESMATGSLATQVSSLLGMLGGGGTEARLIHGQALQAEGEYEQAAEAFLDVIEEDPEHYKAHVALGQVLMFMDRATEAEPFLLKATELDPDDSNGWLFLGYCYHAQGRYDECLAAFSQAVEVEPDSHAARNNLGYAYYLLGQMEEAAQAFIKAGDFGSERAYYNLGMVRLIQGREDDGWQAYDDAAELDPNATQADEHLNDLRVAVERYPEAAPLLQEAIARLSLLIDEDDEDE